MFPKQRITSRAEELRDQWNLLGRKISELEKDRIVETRTEERFRLDQVIIRAKEDRWRLEKELHELEAQSEVKAEAPSQAAQNDLCPPWLREQLLKRFRNDLSCRLESFFGEHGSVTLPKNFSPTDVSRAHSLREKIIEYSLEQAGSEARTIERDVVEIFNQPDINQRLAILGKPGSGKTSCLLRIFDHILKAAEQDSRQPMPVVFECSEWNGEPLPAWMAHQLVVKYDLKKERAGKLVQGELIFPFFDGLDELKGELQEGFVDAFNAFQQGRPMLLCCRITEYRQLKKKVQLNNALVLHDISAQRLEEYLRREKLEDLWLLLQVEPKLLELASRPLFLSIMLQLEAGKLLTGHAGMKSGEDAEQFLWRLYLDCCLDGTPPGGVCLDALTRREYSKEQSLHWLRCLAERMTSDRIVELRIEEMQPSWLYHSQHFKMYYILLYGLIPCFTGSFGATIIYGTAFGISYGLTGWLTHALFIRFASINKWMTKILFWPCYILLYAWLANVVLYRLLIHYGREYLLIGDSTLVGLEYIMADDMVTAQLIYGLILGVSIGLASGMGWLASRWTSSSFRPLEVIDKVKTLRFPCTFYNIKRFIAGISLGIFLGITAGLAVGIFLSGIVLGLSFGIAAGMAAGVILGMNKLDSPVLDTGSPGKNLAYAVQNSIFLTPILSTACMLVLVQISFLAEQLGGMTMLTFYMPIFYLAYMILLTGCFIFLADTVFAHYTLRLLLWQEGQLPLRLVAWLEDLHHRKLLQRVGGSYHFIHKRLQEYLAQNNNASVHEVP